jgi:hypothetical protein
MAGDANSMLVREGMNMLQVRELLGQPMERERWSLPGGEKEFWTFRTEGQTMDITFKNGTVVDIVTKGHPL